MTHPNLFEVKRVSEENSWSKLLISQRTMDGPLFGLIVRLQLDNSRRGSNRAGGDAWVALSSKEVNVFEFLNIQVSRGLEARSYRSA